MIRRLARHALLAACGWSLGGCVAFHSLPPPGYASMPDDGVVRVVFDERGDPWPLAGNAKVRAVLPPEGGLDRSRSFRLARKLAGVDAPYDREAILAEAAARLKPAGRGGADRIVVLINGFNNSYGSFRRKYAALRQWLAEQGAPTETRYVEVYWDALHRAGGKVAYPAALFPRARGNAVRAGACGLRDLLRRLPETAPVSLVGHSLGSQVVLSAITEPPPGRDKADCDRLPTPAPSVTPLADYRVALFAPALGARQVRDAAGKVPASLTSGLSRLLIAWNPNDRVITKRHFGIDLPDSLGGDTRLGGNARFVGAFVANVAANGQSDRVSTVRFAQQAHELSGYLADRSRAACVMWAAKVLPVRPEGCDLAQ